MIITEIAEKILPDEYTIDVTVRRTTCNVERIARLNSQQSTPTTVWEGISVKQLEGQF